MKRNEWVVSIVLSATMALAVMTACERSRSPGEEISAPTAAATPVIRIDSSAKTICITDPVMPAGTLVITIDEVNQTQTFACGEFTMVSGQGYLAAAAGDDHYEVSWQDVGDTGYTERYYVNGEVLALEIDGKPSEAQTRAFVDFYTANDTGLGSHPDLTAMADLWARAAPELATLVRANHPALSLSSGIGPGQMELGMGKWLRRACGVAAACASIACKLAPVTNPFCWVCGGISLGCLIASLVAD